MRVGLGPHHIADTRGRSRGAAPMDGCKQRAAKLAVADRHLEHARPVRAGNSGMPVLGEVCRYRIRGMDFNERLRQMRAEPRAHSRARHGVPLVAHAPGVEAEGEFRADGVAVRALVRDMRVWKLRCDEACLAVWRIKSTICEKPPLLAAMPLLAAAQRPLHWIEGLELGIADIGEAAKIEGAPAVVLEGGERRMLAKDLRRGMKGKCRCKSQSPRDLRDDPPVGPGLARGRQKRPLTGNSALRVGDGPVLLAPCASGKQNLRA